MKKLYLVLNGLIGELEQARIKYRAAQVDFEIKKDEIKAYLEDKINYRQLPEKITLQNGQTVKTEDHPREVLDWLQDNIFGGGGG